MQVLRAKFPEGTEVFTEERLQAYADQIGLSRSAPARYSWAFILKLYAFERVNGIDPAMIVAEIRRLEGLDSPVGTKSATEFTRSPLRGLWHQHFFSGRFVPQNILSQLQGGKVTAALANQYLDPQTDGTVGDKADWEGFVQAVTIKQFEERFEQGRITGEWIVFAKHEGKNYYLTLSVHTTGEADQALFDEIRMTCSPQFPFLSVLNSA